VAGVVHPTVEQWAYLGGQWRAGWRFPAEYLEGEVVMMVPGGDAAGSVSIELAGQLTAWRDRTGDGGLLLADAFVYVGGSIVAPDVSWWTAARRPDIEFGAVRTVPDLVVEVLSPGTRANDLGVKRALYRREGVRELWLVDPEARTIDVDGERRAHLAASETLTTPLLPGFAMPLARAFAQLPPR